MSATLGTAAGKIKYPARARREADAPSGFVLVIQVGGRTLRAENSPAGKARTPPLENF